MAASFLSEAERFLLDRPLAVEKPFRCHVVPLLVLFDADEPAPFQKCGNTDAAAAHTWVENDAVRVRVRPDYGPARSHRLLRRVYRKQVVSPVTWEGQKVLPML